MKLAMISIVVAFAGVAAAAPLEGVRSSQDVVLTDELVRALDKLGDRIGEASAPPVDLSGYATTNDVAKAAKAISVDMAATNMVAASGAVAYSRGPVTVTIPAGGVLDVAGTWPEGKPVFVRVVPKGAYSVASIVRHVGYGGWPTGAWQGVAYSMGGLLYVNVLVEE